MSSAKVGRFSPSSVAAQGLFDRVTKELGVEDGSFAFQKTFPRVNSQTSSETQSRGSSEGSSSPPYINYADPSNYATAFNRGPNKCRQLPCRTFISAGSCPYADKCVFLHSAEVVSKPVYVKIKRKSKDDTVTDTFFWPTMPLSTVMSKLDARNQPEISQPYIVPAPGSFGVHHSINDAAVYSMWEHFLDFLATDSLSVVTQPRAVPPLNPFQVTNRYTGKNRLSVFRALSQVNSNGR